MERKNKIKRKNTVKRKNQMKRQNQTEWKNKMKRKNKVKRRRTSSNNYLLSDKVTKTKIPNSFHSTALLLKVIAKKFAIICNRIIALTNTLSFLASPSKPEKYTTNNKPEVTGTDKQCHSYSDYII